MDFLEIFISAIHKKKKLKIKFNSMEKGIIERTCIPYDFAPPSRSKDKREKYHFCDIDSPDGMHTLSIYPEQLVELKILNENFNPADYVNWTPNWTVKRDWGIYS